MSALEGQQVLVIGGSSGIGLAAARTAEMQGAAVAIASRSNVRLQAALAQLPPQTIDISQNGITAAVMSRIMANQTAILQCVDLTAGNCLLVD
jgi:NAD(P)-dependent dehydrogenase (short-subunit alcohol dehydrogenase family)